VETSPRPCISDRSLQLQALFSVSFTTCSKIIEDNKNFSFSFPILWQVGNPLKAHALHSCSEGIDDYPLEQVEKKLTSPNSPQSIDHMTAGYQYYGL